MKKVSYLAEKGPFDLVGSRREPIFDPIDNEVRLTIFVGYTSHAAGGTATGFSVRSAVNGQRRSYICDHPSAAILVVERVGAERGRPFSRMPQPVG